MTEEEQQKQIEVSEKLNSLLGSDNEFQQFFEKECTLNHWSIHLNLKDEYRGYCSYIKCLKLVTPNGNGALYKQCIDNIDGFEYGDFAVAIDMESNNDTKLNDLIEKRKYHKYLCGKLDEAQGNFKYFPLAEPSPKEPSGERYGLKIFFGPCKGNKSLYECCVKVASFIQNNPPNEEELMKINIDKERPNKAYIFPLESIAKLKGGEIRENINGFITIIAVMTKNALLSYCDENGNRRNCLRIAHFMPGIATLIGKENGTDENFRGTFHEERENTHTGNFKIGNESIRLFHKGGISDIITYFSNNIYPKYKDTIKDAKIQFIFKYKTMTVSKKEDNESKSYTPDEFKSLVERTLGNISMYYGTIPGDSNSDWEDEESEEGTMTYPHNRIIFGAPGTGKSHKANLDANELLLGKRKEDKVLTKDEKKAKASHMERVTFHPDYSYYDFVGSYKPFMDKAAKPQPRIEYKFVPGPFIRILEKALKDKDKNHPYLLLIEEINRARVAAVFGDIFQLLDRTKGGESEYSICLAEDLKEHLKEQGLPLNELMLPPNLYIWATMNSADQGVYPLDTAFKRRWSMEYLDIDSGKEEDDWNQIRTGINKLLIEKGHVNEDKLMGYYFLKAEERDTEDHLKEALAGKVLMYLFDDAAKPCRKDIFKEINKARIYSDLRVKLSLSEPNLGIFDGAVFWPGKNTTTGSDQDNAAPKAEEAEPVDNQQ